MKKLTVVLLMVGGLMVAGMGCNKDKDAGGDKGGGDKAASSGATGVAECDDYFKKYEACLGKVPAVAKPAMEQAFNSAKDAIKANAATPEGKAALKTQCKAMTDALAQNPSCK